MKSQIIAISAALVLAACGGGGSAAEPDAQAMPDATIMRADPVTQSYIQPVTAASDAWQIAADSAPTFFAKPFRAQAWILPVIEIERPACKSGSVTIYTELQITAEVPTSKNRETYLAVMPNINGVARDDMRLIDTIPSPGATPKYSTYTYRKTLPAEAMPAGKIGIDVRKFADDGLALTITHVMMDVTCSGAQ